MAGVRSRDRPETMTKPTRPLTGFAKDAWIRRQVAEGGSPEDVTRRLQRGIASLKVREDEPSAGISDRHLANAAGDRTSDAPAPDVLPFDPYSPNVVVVIRTKGVEAARAALAAIASAENLRLLAREQSLSIDAGVTEPADIAAAIIAAAERRIANRRAAAS